jgi:hypothetical protein
LSQLLLGVGAASGDKALTLLHGPSYGAEEQRIQNESEENNLNRHQRQGGIEVKKTSLRDTCFGEQKPAGHLGEGAGTIGRD